MAKGTSSANAVDEASSTRDEGVDDEADVQVCVEPGGDDPVTDEPSGEDEDPQEETQQGSELGEDPQAELEHDEDVAAALQAAEDRQAALKDQILRLAADFDNFRKRTERERADIRRLAAAGLVADLLPVVDNLERALAHARDDADPVITGVRMVSRQFMDVLASNGVTPVESLHQPFDPELHEAVGQIPSDEHLPGTVVQELQKGYMLHDRLHRAAQVIVAAQPPEPHSEPSDAEEQPPGDDDPRPQDAEAEPAEDDACDDGDRDAQHDEGVVDTDNGGSGAH